MAPWRVLNLKGKILAVCVFINMYVSILYVTTGSYIAILPVIMAMICGLSTYKARYQHVNVSDLNKHGK